MDLDPGCRLSMRLLPPEKWLELEVAGNSAAAWMPAFLSLGEAPDLGRLVWWSQVHQVSLVSGWLGAEQAMFDVDAHTRGLGFGPNPAEFLWDSLDTLGQHADVLVLVPPVGLGVLTRIALATSEAAIAFLGTDPIGPFDGERTTALVHELGAAALFGLDEPGLCWAWDAPGLSPELAAKVRRDLRRAFPKGRELQGFTAWRDGGAQEQLASDVATVVERLVTRLLPGAPRSTVVRRRLRST
ncbi:MAG: hypothetical protein ABIO70_29040 [Pseudomonadota bacterium]